MPLEQRFTILQIEAMMRDARFLDLRFSKDAPFWCVIGLKA